jgi:hypothetical protein
MLTREEAKKLYENVTLIFSTLAHFWRDYELYIKQDLGQQRVDIEDIIKRAQDLEK